MSESSTLQIVLSTCPRDKAKRLAGLLLERHLAACVNVLGSVRSLYRWEGRVVDEAEALMVIKTTAERREELFRVLADEHPYTVPEIVALPTDTVLPAYLDWAVRECRDPDHA